MNPLLSIITVNYNGLDETGPMIESLGRHLTIPYEVIVVDNGSERDEASVLRNRYPDVTVIRSERNLGFAGGNNLGLPSARGKYILLLNNDTLIEDDSLKYLCDRLDSDPGAGAVCPKIRFAFPPRHIQFAGYTPLTGITLRNALIGFDRPDDGSLDEARTTPYAHGAAMMVRREVIERVGPMTEVYFLYYEELDWSTRITEAGYRIWYEPRSTVFHKESRTTGAESPLKTYYLTRNRLLYGWRNRHGATRWLTLLYQTAVAAPKNALLQLLRRRGDLSRATLRGVCAFYGLKHKMN